MSSCLHTTEIGEALYHFKRPGCFFKAPSMSVVGNGISGCHQQYLARLPGRSAMGGPESWVSSMTLLRGRYPILTHPNECIYGKHTFLLFDEFLHKMGNFLTPCCLPGFFPQNFDQMTCWFHPEFV